MKKFLGITALLVFASSPAFAQSTPARDPDRTGATERYDEPRHNWNWIGLLGLAGLAGLRTRKSEAAERLESRGVKVKTV